MYDIYDKAWRGAQDKALYDDDFGDSDTEKEPDAYLARVKAEAQERDDDDDSDSDSTDEDFNPDKARESDVAEESVPCFYTPTTTLRRSVLQRANRNVE
jgi:hypothetical protein